MTKASRFSGHLQSNISKVARRIRNRMNQLGLSEAEMANLCGEVARAILPEEEQPRMSRERIAKILMNCKAMPEKSAARVLTYQELLVLCMVLKVSLAWLTGQENNRDPVLWDPLAEPQRAEHILHLMHEHEERAGELLVWGEYLLCSLVTPQFMHKNHEARFSELDALGLHKEKQKVVQLYDRIGNVRRKRLLTAGSDRQCSFTQLLFLSELEKIGQGILEYKKISRGVRKKCLENLAQLVADQSLEINLIITRESDVAHLKAALRDYDSIGVFGGEFAMWNYHSGRVAWSENPAHVTSYRRLLKEIQERAAYREREDVLGLLQRVSASI